MDVLKKLADSIVVPVVVLDKAEDAVPTAKALLAGGVGVMEITFRTAAAPDAIRAVAENCPEMLVGAPKEEEALEELFALVYESAGGYNRIFEVPEEYRK